jgi:hypothetical protein
MPGSAVESLVIQRAGTLRPRLFGGNYTEAGGRRAFSACSLVLNGLDNGVNQHRRI